VFDEALAQRVRELVLATPGLTEKRMFGGLAFQWVNRGVAFARSLPVK
jgi:hypothetical protein